MKTVIFICTGNTCRSPMAEVLFKRKIESKGYDFEVLSRGLSAIEGQPATQNAVDAVKEYGLDLTTHRAAMLKKEELESADLLVCMTEEHKRILTSIGVLKEKIAVLGIADPYMCDLAVYKECAKIINDVGAKKQLPKL